MKMTKMFCILNACIWKTRSLC